MSILIKGVTLDELKELRAYELINRFPIWVEQGRIVEVKTPHGKLIDATRLLWEEGQMAVIQDAAYGRGREGMKEAIRNAPPVIETEE